MNDHWASIELDNFYMNIRQTKLKARQMSQHLNYLIQCGGKLKQLGQAMINNKFTHIFGVALYRIYKFFHSLK
jgi:hypothetical protein